MFYKIKNNCVCVAISAIIFIVLWVPLIAVFALRIWDLFLLIPLFVFFKTAKKVREMVLYFTVSILMMIIPVYFIEYHSIGEDVGRAYLGNYHLLPQTANGKAAWLLCIPWISSFVPLFLADYSQKGYSKKTKIKFVSSWGVLAGINILNYSFCF